MPEMEKFYEIYTWQKPIQKEVALYVVNKLNLLLKIFLKKNPPGPNDFSGEFYQTFEKEILPIMNIFFQETEEGRRLNPLSTQALIYQIRYRYYK